MSTTDDSGITYAQAILPQLKMILLSGGLEATLGHFTTYADHQKHIYGGKVVPEGQLGEEFKKFIIEMYRAAFNEVLHYLNSEIDFEREDKAAFEELGEWQRLSSFRMGISNFQLVFKVTNVYPMGDLISSMSTLVFIYLERLKKYLMKKGYGDEELARVAGDLIGDFIELASEAFDHTATLITFLTNFGEYFPFHIKAKGVEIAHRIKDPDALAYFAQNIHQPPKEVDKSRVQPDQK
jgi:hypothetical protein